MHTVRIALTVAVLAVLALTGPALATAPAAALGAVGTAAKPGAINYYETPCQIAARKKFGVPLFNEALVRWQRDHLGTSEGAAYNAAALACPRPAKWDWDAMVLVGTE